MTNERIISHFENISQKYGLEDFEEVSRKIREAKKVEDVEKNIPDYRKSLKDNIDTDLDAKQPKNLKGKRKGLMKAADILFISDVVKLSPDYDIINKQAGRRRTQIDRFEKQTGKLDEDTLIAFRGKSVKSILEEGFDESDINLSGTGFEIRNGKIERIVGYIG